MRAALAAGALVMMLTACGGGVETHLTVTQANDQLTAYVNEPIAALPAGATITPLDGSALKPRLCSDRSGADPSGPKSAQAMYWVRGLDTTKNADYLNTFVARWTGRGWRVVTDSRPRDPFVNVESKDGYGLSLQTSVDGTNALSINGSSPCAKQS